LKFGDTNRVFRELVGKGLLLLLRCFWVKLLEKADKLAPLGVSQKKVPVGSSRS